MDRQPTNPERYMGGVGCFGQPWRVGRSIRGMERSGWPFGEERSAGCARQTDIAALPAGERAANLPAAEAWSAKSPSATN
jgi:hypothetical protein